MTWHKNRRICVELLSFYAFKLNAIYSLLLLRTLFRTVFFFITFKRLFINVMLIKGLYHCS